MFNDYNIRLILSQDKLNRDRVENAGRDKVNHPSNSTDESEHKKSVKRYKNCQALRHEKVFSDIY